MTMKHLISACYAACLFSLYASNSYACSCVIPEVPQAFRAARAVFVGEVTEIVAPRTNNPKAPLGDQLYAIRFKVERSWKGVRSTEVTVLSDQGRAGCFSWGPFLRGKKYLVYGERRTPSGAPIRTLAVLFSCNRTALLADASEDLKMLETGKFSWGGEVEGWRRGAQALIYQNRNRLMKATRCERSLEMAV